MNGTTPIGSLGFPIANQQIFNGPFIGHVGVLIYNIFAKMFLETLPIKALDIVNRIVLLNKNINDGCNIFSR